MNAKADDLIDNLVSVVMPAYNCEATVLESINSVIRQTYSKFELIIVDDGSKDNTYKVLKRFKDFPNIIIIRSKINYGISITRNIAISKARGQYIAFLDSDDTWHEDKLKIQVNLMKNNNYFCCHSTYTRKDKTLKKAKIIKAQKFIRKSDMLKGNKIGNLTGIYDATKLSAISANIGVSSTIWFARSKFMSSLIAFSCANFSSSTLNVPPDTFFTPSILLIGLIDSSGLKLLRVSKPLLILPLPCQGFYACQ